MVTVAVRRVQTVAAGHAGLMEAIDWSRIWMLPNTAGCTNAGASPATPATRASSTRGRTAGGRVRLAHHVGALARPSSVPPLALGLHDGALARVALLGGPVVVPVVDATPVVVDATPYGACHAVVPTRRDESSS